MSEIELKPCPFCGGKPEQKSDFGDYFVECTNCHAISGITVTKEFAIKDWNTRQTEDAFTARVEELETKFRDGYDPKERLPETEDYYLTELELNDGDIHIIPLYFSHGEFNKSCGIVIRWYPLPPAGKEGE